MYAAHKGRYTTLCMFWMASDIFKKRLDEGRIDEAVKILEALKRMQPCVEEINKELDTQAAATPAATAAKLPWEKNEQQQSGTSAAAFIASASRRLAKALKTNGSRRNNRSGISDSSQEEISAISARQQESATPSEGINEQLLKNYPGHLIVSLGEGIIRPIEGINAPQRVVLACLTAHPGYNVPQISDSTGIPAKSIERHVSALIARNLIEHRGSKKTGGYYAK